MVSNTLHSQATSPYIGNSCIRDTRVFMEVLNGRAITFAIARKDVLERWPPMQLDESLKPTVDEIQTPTFQMNVTYDK